MNKNQIITEEKLEIIKNVALQAGEITKEYFQKDFDITIKPDSSPVTSVDYIVDHYLRDHLKDIFPESLYISEEDEHHPEITDHSRLFWLIDPIDGTKGYIKGDKNYSINIALVQYNEPIFGLIHLPMYDKNYYNFHSQAYVQEKLFKPKIIKTSKNQQFLRAVTSSSFNKKTSEILENLGVQECESICSTRKFCLLSEGQTDIYVKNGPTMEWDTAAGQAILEAAGGKMLDFSGKVFSYGKKNYRNTDFIAFGNPSLEAKLKDIFS